MPRTIQALTRTRLLTQRLCCVCRYIPFEMAYGAGGKPPKIPAAATLIFIMEIVKIKSKDTAPWKGTFPTWTAEEEALWLDKDEAACQSWRAGRVSAENSNSRPLPLLQTVMP